MLSFLDIQRKRRREQEERRRGGEKEEEEIKRLNFTYFRANFLIPGVLDFGSGRAGEFSACCFHQLEKQNHLWEGLPWGPGLDCILLLSLGQCRGDPEEHEVMVTESRVT